MKIELHLTSRISEGITVKYLLITKQHQELLNVLNSNSNFVLGEDTIHFLGAVKRTRLVNTIFTIHFRRVRFVPKVKYTDFYSNSMDNIKMNEFNNCNITILSEIIAGY